MALTPGLPDDERILFSSTRSGPANLYVQRADGAGQVQRVTDSAANQLTTTISPDGRSVVLLEQHTGTGNDLSLLRLDARPDTAGGSARGGSAPVEWKLKTEPFIATSYTEAHPELGRRFLMIKEPGGEGRDAPPPTISVVLNWLNELKEKLPAK